MKLTKFCGDRGIHTFDQVLEKKTKAVRHQPVRLNVIKISDLLVLLLTKRFDVLILVNGDEVHLLE